MIAKARHSLLPLLLSLLASGALAADPPPAETADSAAAAPAAAAPDTEQRLAEALRAEVMGGEVLTLQADGREVLALFTPQTHSQALGGVLLLHDHNANPDAPGVIHTLRRQLPEAGWHSLALQLPHSATAQLDVALLDSHRSRIAEALAELERRNIRNVVLIGHGQGALAAVDYLADNLVPSVTGLVLIGLDGRAQTEPRLDAAARLAQLKVPMLDIYGSRDYPAVVASVKRRYDLARRSEDGGSARPGYAEVARDYDEEKGLTLSYRQVEIAGADHHYSSHTSLLEKRVRGWLNRYAVGTEIKE